MAKISLRGQAVNTVGDLPGLGSEAPTFTLVDAKLRDRSLAEYGTQKKLLSIVPSLDTPVCAKSTKTLNDLAAEFADVEVLVISADLPFAQGRFCGIEKLKNLQALSTMRSPTFAQDYGVLMNDGPLAGLCARAVLVLDGNNRVLHQELVTDITHEPDYSALRAVLSS